MTLLETALLAALSRRLAGEGELNIKPHTRDDGSTFLTCERLGGFWGITTDDVNALADVVVNSLINDVPNLSQDEIVQQFLNPAEMGRKGGLKGGLSKTPAKQASSAANGKKGGRPKKTLIVLPGVFRNEFLVEIDEEEYWLQDSAVDVLDEHNITADSTDSELDDATKKIDADALSRNVSLSSTRHWLGLHRQAFIDAKAAVYDDYEVLQPAGYYTG